MKWVRIIDKLPPEPINRYSGDKYLVTVATGINNQVIAVNYVKRTIRNKEVIRWEWEGRICPWDIIAWMSFPEPYKE